MPRRAQNVNSPKLAIGLSSDYRALSGHWAMLGAIFGVAVVGKLVGCSMAAMATGMDWVRSLRVGCGMVSRGEVGLIVTAMGASSGIFADVPGAWNERLLVL